MRCLSCGVILKDHECVRKGSVTGEYIDMCDRCFSTISNEVSDVDDDYAKVAGEDHEDDDTDLRTEMRFDSYD